MFEAQAQNKTDLREQDIVLRIIKKNLGKSLIEPKHQNELFLHYLASKIKEVEDLLYDNKTIAARANSWIPIETINRTAGDMQKGIIEIIGHEYLKTRDTKVDDDKKTRIRYDHLTPSRKIIADVLIDFAQKKIPIDYSADSTRLVLRCWKRQDAELAKFLDDNSSVEWDANEKNVATAISMTRLRRFAEAEIRKQYDILHH